MQVSFLFAFLTLWEVTLAMKEHLYIFNDIYRLRILSICQDICLYIHVYRQERERSKLLKEDIDRENNEYNYMCITHLHLNC